MLPRSQTALAVIVYTTIIGIIAVQLIPYINNITLDFINDFNNYVSDISFSVIVCSLIVGFSILVYLYPISYVNRVFAFLPMFWLTFTCKMIPEIALDFKDELPWLAKKAGLISQYLIGFINVTFFVGQQYLQNLIDIRSKKCICSIIGVMLLVTIFNMFNPISNNSVLLVSTAFLYLAGLIANSFSMGNSSDDDSIGSQVLANCAPYVSRVIHESSTTLNMYNDHTYSKKIASKDLFYFWCIISCLLFYTVFIIYFTNHKQIYTKEIIAKKKAKVALIDIDWTSLCVVLIVCVCFQFPDQIHDYLTDKLVKSNTKMGMGSSWYSENVYPLSLVFVWILICVLVDKYKYILRLHSVWAFFLICVVLSPSICFLKLLLVHNMTITKIPIWKIMATWFGERIINECVRNIAIQISVSVYCKHINKPNSLNNKLIISNQIPHLVVPWIFPYSKISKLIETPEEQLYYLSIFPRVTFVTGIIGFLSLSYIIKTTGQKKYIKNKTE